MADCCLSSSRTNSLRCSLASAGFGSKVSMWEGPPSIIRKMQRFAFAGKWPSFGASGPVDGERLCSAIKAEKATLPKLAPSEYTNSRRVGDHKARCPAQGKGVGWLMSGRAAHRRYAPGQFGQGR